MPQHWLLKTEPDVFSIDDLKKAGVEPWDGIRNYQARNFLRDTFKKGDKVFIYHSRSKPMGIVGEAEVVSDGYPDPTQFDPKEKYYDAKADPENPRWYLVDVKYVRTFPEIITLADLKAAPELADMAVVKKGARLSVQPVKENEWHFVQSMTETK